MLLFPDVQAIAHGEINMVVGNDRLARSDDRERLPYINALVLEVSRWHTVAPSGGLSTIFSYPRRLHGVPISIQSGCTPLNVDLLLCAVQKFGVPHSVSERFM